VAKPSSSSLLTGKPNVLLCCWFTAHTYGSDAANICRVLKSIKANRRLPESRFSPLKLAPKNQNSVLGMMRAAPSTTTKTDQG
jgi:hypothetical protein